MTAQRPPGQAGMLVAIAALIIAAVVGVLPFVPALVQQLAWIVAILVAGGWALWDWRRRAVDKRDRAARHRERMAQRGQDGPPRGDGS
ncbi:hypothetical protein [Demequina activiva]|uniref:Uncharacterized protein n=1 Tax=Demequina activiva TaxID=1582364 RepID=A0A919PZ82_9MICO|nr:hypothetical protein [Demequina activiva]GIG53415.1 hypothetical protein Dac01nite_01670 [Demequina activiva]